MIIIVFLSKSDKEGLVWPRNTRPSLTDFDISLHIVSFRKMGV